MKIKNRIYLTSVLIIAAISIMFALESYKLRSEIFDVVRNKDMEMLKGFYKTLNARTKSALAANKDRLMSTPGLLEAVSAKDKDLIDKLVRPNYNSLSSEYGKDTSDIRIISKGGTILFSGKSPKLIGREFSSLHTHLFENVKSIEDHHGYLLCPYNFSINSLTIVKDGDKRVGLIEQAVEISFFAKKLKMITGYDTIVTLDHINNATYRDYIKVFGKWIVAFSSNRDFSDSLFTSNQGETNLPNIFKNNDKYYSTTPPMPFEDIHGEVKGSIYFTKDVTSEYLSMKKEIVSSTLKTSALVIAIIIFLRLVSGKIIRKLERDISQKSSELKASEYKYKSYVNNSPNAVFVFNDSMNFVEANINATKFTGFSQSELLSMSVSDLCLNNDTDKHEFFFRSLMNTGNSEDIMKISTKEGSNIDLYVRSCKISQGRYLCTAIDVSRQVRMEERLKELNRELEGVNRNLEIRINEEVERNRNHELKLAEQRQFLDMSDMMKAVAHKWRQPLNALGLYIQDISESLNLSDDDKREIEDFEEVAMKLVNDMSMTIDDFTLFSQSKPSKSEFEIVKEIRDTFQLISINLAYKDITASFSCSNTEACDGVCKDELVALYGSVSEFRQVIQQVVTNAIDAIEDYKKNRTDFRGEISVKMVCRNNNFTIKIEDNAAGVPEEDLYKIFNPYYSGREDSGKSGMGLYIVKRTVENSFRGEVSAFNSDKGGLGLNLVIPVIIH